MKQLPATNSNAVPLGAPPSTRSTPSTVGTTTACLWLTERAYALRYGLQGQTLRRWRMEDRRAGRKCAQDNYPYYKYFGHSVRYRADD